MILTYIAAGTLGLLLFFAAPFRFIREIGFGVFFLSTVAFWATIILRG